MKKRYIIILLGLILTVVIYACIKDVEYDYAREQRLSSQQYKIGIGDELYVSVWENKQLSNKVKVRPDGSITMELIGEITAAKRTPSELQEEITRRLRRFMTEVPAVTVNVARVGSYSIYVLGKVRNPGQFNPNHPVTVLQALALAGGMTEFANPNDIIIIRNDDHGQRRIPFVYEQVIRNGRLEMNITLISGDTVSVQ